MTAVIINTLEVIYLAGFPILQLFVLLFPLATRKPSGSLEGVDGGKTLEFLPLMVTSIYCAIGLVWAYIRLSALYLTQK